jgi:hypothetical protein
MPWGRAEVAPEVLDWLIGLSDDDFGHVAYHIDLLQELGPRLGEPHARQLEGRLRVLRFHLGTRAFGLTHCVAGVRRIALLTVFREDQPTEETEIRRGVATLDRCIIEGCLSQEQQEETRDHATA